MSVTDMNFKDENFDLVLLLEVLEHVDEPFKAAKEIHRVLKPNGYLIASTPFTFGIHGHLLIIGDLPNMDFLIYFLI